MKRKIKESLRHKFNDFRSLLYQTYMPNDWREFMLAKLLELEQEVKKAN